MWEATYVQEMLVCYTISTKKEIIKFSKDYCLLYIVYYN